MRRGRQTGWELSFKVNRENSQNIASKNESNTNAKGGRLSGGQRRDKKKVRGKVGQN